MKLRLPKKLSCLTFVILLLPIGSPAAADFAVGLEYAQVERRISEIDVESEDGISYSFSIAFDLRNSFFQIKHARESSDFVLSTDAFQFKETSTIWHYNQTTRNDKNGVSAGVGFFYSQYDIFNVIEEDFLGFTMGISGTRVIIDDRFYLTGQAWFRFPFSEAEQDGSNPSDQQDKFLTGYELLAAIGFRFGGSQSKVDILAGTRFRMTDFSDRLAIDDERHDQLFFAVRIYIATGTDN